MLATLDLVFVAELIRVPRVIRLCLAAATLVMLGRGGFMRSLLRILVRMLPAFDLRVVARLILTTSVLLVCHENCSYGLLRLFVHLCRLSPLDQVATDKCDPYGPCRVVHNLPLIQSGLPFRQVGYHLRAR